MACVEHPQPFRFDDLGIRVAVKGASNRLGVRVLHNRCEVFSVVMVVCRQEQCQLYGVRGSAAVTRLRHPALESDRVPDRGGEIVALLTVSVETDDDSMVGVRQSSNRAW